MPTPLVYVNGKAINDSPFICKACGVKYLSQAELGFVRSRTGSLYDRQYFCVYCERGKKKDGTTSENK